MDNEIKAIAFDLDGTIYWGETLIPGVLDLLEFLKIRGIKAFFFTNNSTKTRYQIAAKLAGLGITAPIIDIYTSAYAAAIYLKNGSFHKVYCVGTDGLSQELTNQGIDVIEEGKNADVLVVGLDPHFSYVTLLKASILLQGGLKAIACNRDNNYPIEGGRLMPGCGVMVGAIEQASGKTIDHMVGKPNDFMMRLLFEDHQLKSNEILVIGDSYESDIQMAQRANCPSILISDGDPHDVSGVTVVDQIAKVRPLLFS